MIRPIRYSLIYPLLFFIVSCMEADSEIINPGIAVVPNSYDDGTYCANVSYYNPNTHRHSEYKLNVEVKDGLLTKIFWSNGGFLDNTHFTTPQVSTDGSCSFTSDRGYEYTIDIIGPECRISYTPTDFEGSVTYVSVQDCALIYGASKELLDAYLNERNASSDEMITEKECDLMHESLATLGRLKALEKKIEEGYIQKFFLREYGHGGICQNIVVKRHGSYYLLNINEGKATMGLTSFNPSIEDWQEIMIQKNPNEDKWVVVMAKVIATGSKYDMEKLSESICQ